MDGLILEGKDDGKSNKAWATCQLHLARCHRFPCGWLQVHVRMQQRNGRKSWTTVAGFPEQACAPAVGNPKNSLRQPTFAVGSTNFYLVAVQGQPGAPFPCWQSFRADLFDCHHESELQQEPMSGETSKIWLLGLRFGPFRNAPETHGVRPKSV